jgi:replicative DNA helicase
MSAARARLDVVHAPDQPADHWAADTLTSQWQPAHQLTGALMWLPAAAARPILDMVPDDAIARPLTRWAYEVIRTVVDAGDDPTPPVVLAAAKHQPARDALQADQPPTGQQLRRIALYLYDAYSQTVSPEAAAATYAREVLHDAYRRAFLACGIRMEQLGECGADRADLTTQFTRIKDELADLWRRCETAAKPGWDRP